MRILPSSVRLALAAVLFSTTSAVGVDATSVGNPGNANDPHLSAQSCGFSNDTSLIAETG